MKPGSGRGSALGERGATVLVNRGLWFLLLGQAVSQLGDSLFFVAVLWFTQQTLGSTVSTGLVGAAVTAPALVGLVTGVLVDRWNRKATMVFSDVSRALLVLIVPLAYAYGAVSLGTIATVVVLLGIAGQFFLPARQAFLPRLVSERALTEANAALSLAHQSSQVAGQALGGILIPIVGTLALFYLDALSFVVSALAVVLISASGAVTPASRASPVGPGEKGFLRDFGDGLSFVARQPVVRLMVVTAAVVNLGFGPLFVLMPAWAHDVMGYGPEGYALLQGILSAGLIAGSLVPGVLSRFALPERMVPWGVTAIGVGLTGFAMAGGLGSLAFLFLVGGANSVVNVSIVATLQKVVPDQVRGRAFGSLSAFAMAGLPIAMVLGGFGARALSLQGVITAGGSLVISCGIFLAVAVAGYRRPAGPPSPPGYH